MKRTLLILLPVLTIACQPTKKENTHLAIDTTSTSLTPLLSAEQRADGWIALFNGHDLKGWRFYQDKENNSWEVKDGALHCKPFDGFEKRSDLMTTGTYDNFELTFDWKVAPQGNSGVMFRVTEEFPEPYMSGPEYQVIDDKGWPGDPLKETQLAGSDYDMYAAPPNKKLNPIDQWNSSRIVVNGNHVEHWLNGEKLFEYELQSDEWKKLKADSKWNDAHGYGSAKSGHIALQDHGQEVWFKNIFLKKL